MLITRNIAQYPLHHVTYAPAVFKVATSNGLGGDAFYKKKHYLTLTLFFKAMQNITHYPVNHGTYEPAMFKVATSNSLGGDAFTRK